MDENRKTATEYFLQNNFEAAIQHFKKESEKHLQDGDTGSYIESILWFNHFRILMGEYVKTRSDLKELERKFAKEFGRKNRLDAFHKFYLAYVNFYMGFYRSAGRQIKKSVEWLEKDNEEAHAYCEALMMQGKVYWRVGDMVEALNCFIKAIVSASKSASVPPFVRGKSVNLIGVVLTDIGYHQLAEKYLRISERIYIDEQKLEEGQLYFGILYCDLAAVLLRAEKETFDNQLDLAEELNRKAEKIFDNIFKDKPHRYKASVLKNKARLQKERDEKNHHCREVVKILEEKIEMREKIFQTYRHATIARARNHQTRACIRSGKLEQALEYVQKALNASSSLFEADPSLRSLDLKDLSGNVSKPQLLRALHNKAEIHLKQFLIGHIPDRLVDTFYALRLAVRLISQMRREFHSEEARLILLEQTRPIHELAMEVLFQLHEQRVSGIPLSIEEVFEIVQQNTASLLLEEIVYGPEINDAQDLELGNKPQFIDFRELFAQLLKLLEGSRFSELLIFQQKASLFFRRKMRDEQRLLEKEVFPFRKYSLKKIKEGIEDDSGAVLAYFLGKENLYGLLIRRDRYPLQVLKLSKGKEQIEKLTSKVEVFVGIIDRRMPAYSSDKAHSVGDDENPKRDYIRIAYELYEILIQPFDLNRTDRIYIIPDGVLWRLPFEALIQRLPVEKSPKYCDLDYLHHNYLLTRHFSLPLLYLLHGSKNKNERQVDSFFAVLGHVKDSVEEELALGRLYDWKRLFEQAGFHAFDPLIHSHGPKKTDVLKFMGLFDVICIHAHGGIHDERGMIFPALKIGENTYILPQDIRAGCRLKCQLLIINSCFSNSGPVRRGEGMLTLSRAFLSPQSKSIISTLFTVSPHASTDLLDQFFKLLLRESPERSIASALDKAKREISMREDSTPYDWSGLVFVGDQLASLIPRGNVR